MASSLGTVLIQRIDAALGNATSSQTSIARSATDAVRQPAQTDKSQHTANQIQRDQRENVDRAAVQQIQSGKGKGIDRDSAQALARGNLPTGFTTTSVNTTLGSAAKIILQLFANHSFGSTPLQGRHPLINQSPNNPSNAANNTGTQNSNVGSNTSNPNLTAAQVARAQSLINTITNSNQNLVGSRLTQAINTAYKADGAPNNQLSAQIARSLIQNISQSGLFYESHIKAYTDGQFKLADIRQEPQAQANSNNANTTQTQQGANAPNQQAQTANQGGANTNLSNITQQTSTNLAANTNPNAANTAQNLQSALPTPGVDPNTHNIVRQQLEVLADQSIQWRGEAWPGAEMQWRIQRNHYEDQNPDNDVNEDQAQWQTNLKLRLPSLGDINANIGINGNKIFLNIQAQEDKIESLKSNSNQLAQQLTDRQLELIRLNLNALNSNNDSNLDPQTDSNEDNLD